MTKAPDAPDTADERHLFGHGPQHPRAVLTDLAAEAGADEEPDRYGEGSLITDFERDIAALLGKEAAVFLPSGTMAQQIALRIWAGRARTSTVAFHPTCHLEIHEQKGYELLHGLHGRLVGERSQLITLADLQATPGPLAALLLELPQREIGGQLPSWSDLVAQTTWAREQGAAVHMDGARLWESGPFYQRPYAEIAALFDSVYVSFYKGIGAIAGAALAGPAAFISEARLWQRRHGGNLVQLYPFVLSARANLRRRRENFRVYRDRAQAVARVLTALPGITVKPDPPQTNMMHVYLQCDAEALVEAADELARTERVLLFRRLIPTGVPGVAAFELTIGDAVEAFTDHEIQGYIEQLMARAGVQPRRTPLATPAAAN
ncbi:MAG TPA: beta-eliminating lyase-related protein [Chloroflexota bacterium]|nr:beta-eliminating lyase-related protein [Chloroflexota bacterium]